MSKVQTPTLIFDGANGSIVERMSEIDWTRVFGVSAEDVAIFHGEGSVDPDGHDGRYERVRDERVRDNEGTFKDLWVCDDSCEKCSDHRSEAFDDLVSRTTHALATGDVSGDVLSVARDAEKERGIDAAIEVLRGNGALLWRFDASEGDLFLIPLDWEASEDGAGWQPSAEVVARWALAGENGCQVDITIEGDSTPVRGNAIESGDAARDREVEDEIIARLRDGDTWAWCAVKVTVTAGGVEASDYLGACSYADETDFRACGNFADMIDACVAEILKDRDASWV